jgi:hypothetical protein
MKEWTMTNKKTNDINAKVKYTTKWRATQTNRSGRKEKKARRTEKRRLWRDIKDEDEENKREKKKRIILYEIYVLSTGIPYQAEPCTIKRMYAC